jgi:tetratricopeptide (TPR) repeat protein
MPNSIWAPSVGDALARLQARREATTEDAVAFYRRIVERYPQSPYNDFALMQIAHTYRDANRPADAYATYVEMLRRLPDSKYRSEALRFMVETDQKEGRLTEAARWAEQWTSAAPIYERFDAWIDLAEIRKGLGDSAGAKQAAQETRNAVRAFRKALEANQLKLSPAQLQKLPEAANQADALAQKLL